MLFSEFKRDPPCSVLSDDDDVTVIIGSVCFAEYQFHEIQRRKEYVGDTEQSKPFSRMVS